MSISVCSTSVEEEQRARGLVLGGGADVLIVRQVREKSLDIPPVEFPGGGATDTSMPIAQAPVTWLRTTVRR